MPKRIPKLCHHKATNQAYVRQNGKTTYLGVWGTDDVQHRYDAFVAKRKRDDDSGAFPLTVGELALEYLKHADGYYVRDGKLTSEAGVIKIALKPLVKRSRKALAREFSPRQLKAVRDDMVRLGWVRRSINRHVGRIIRMFKWGVSEEIIPVATYTALTTVTGLKANRCAAAESDPVEPVPPDAIAAIKPFVRRQVWAAIQLQLLTGARPTEVLTMRECDIDATGDVWVYRPIRHKTQHHGKGRTIFIGPKAQQVITPFLKGSATRYLFSPAEAREEFDAERRANRKSPMTPSQRQRQRKAKPQKQAGERYTVVSYRRAIVEACKKAGVTEWSPGQLRHNAATNITATFGDIDAARVVLGHSERSTTQVYAERDIEAAKAVIAKIG